MNLKMNPCLGGIMLSKYGFYISYLILKGENKPDAELKLEQGLNVISGASNTGKTFIFECIDYIFGAKDKPKEIVESHGYTEVLLEIQTYQGKTITFKRNLTDKKMFYFDCGIKHINSRSPIEIKNQHDKNNEKNISKMLLNICGADYTNVLKKQSGHTESFTYRDFAHLTMIHEQEIISSLSPIYLYGAYYKRTRSKSVFKTIMTGMDDSLFKDVKDNDNSKVKVQGQIELVDNLILNTRIEIVKLEEDIQGHEQNSDLLNKSITEVKDKINEKKVVLTELEGKKKSLWQQHDQLQNEKTLLQELKKRFMLLKKNYNSDLERLEFIDESEYYVEQLIDIKCPLCNSYWGDSELTISKKEFNAAINAEREKIQLQLSDLLSAIQDIDIKIENKSSEILNISQEIEEVDNIIDNELKPIISQYLTELDKLLDLRDYYKKKEYNLERLNELVETKNTLIGSMSTETIKNPVMQEISDSIYEVFCSSVKNLLEEWKFEDEVKVEFDKGQMDLRINDRSKKSFGKGYSSLINSAFILSIMKYAISLELPHPKIVVLDSPLTTYKEKDGKTKTGDEVKDIVKQSFYKDLSSYKDIQVIVLDNIDPSKEVQDSINYYHFTRNESIGRYGFIPV
jgi:hypothetical protein